MPLSLVRIDDRLVHGQVVAGWVPFLRAELVLVASDAAAADETQQTLMRLALPDAVGLEVMPVADAARHAALKGDYARRTLVLAPGPQEVLELLERGAAFDRVNVGGLHHTAGRVQLGKAIFLSDADKRALREICRRGVRIEGRALPGERELDILDMIGAGQPA
ncbi:MAG: PTS sugar transporter subunit IIB [Elusimicrobia bacterium]|nr:PTS sugar transporter subunit IIB [Elusimicrobiota bacterium]